MRDRQLGRKIKQRKEAQGTMQRMAMHIGKHKRDELNVREFRALLDSKGIDSSVVSDEMVLQLGAVFEKPRIMDIYVRHNDLEGVIRTTFGSVSQCAVNVSSEHTIMATLAAQEQQRRAGKKRRVAVSTERGAFALDIAINYQRALEAERDRADEAQRAKLENSIKLAKKLVDDVDKLKLDHPEHYWRGKWQDDGRECSVKGTEAAVILKLIKGKVVCSKKAERIDAIASMNVDQTTFDAKFEEHRNTLESLRNQLEELDEASGNVGAGNSFGDAPLVNDANEMEDE